MSNPESKNEISDRLRDGRDAGEWESSYNRSALIQIYLELLYLLGLLIICLLLLYCIALDPSEALIAPPNQAQTFPALSADQTYWIAVALGGTIGGAAFALKWHYHSVARRIWHRDRLVWRITTPIISGVLATFVIMMIKSEIIPLISVEKLSTLTSATSFSFFLGLFSDNLLAALQNLAAQMFGTLRDNNQKDVKPDSNGPGTEDSQQQRSK